MEGKGEQLRENYIHEDEGAVREDSCRLPRVERESMGIGCEMCEKFVAENAKLAKDNENLRS